MAAYPSTTIQFTNSSGQTLNLNAVNIWDGPQQSVIPLVIPVGPTVGVTQQGSVVGIEYKFGNKYSLIAAWMNDGISNKVYAQIIQAGSGVQFVQWDQLKERVNTAGNSFDTNNVNGYRCALVMDAVGGMPTLRATFSKA